MRRPGSRLGGEVDELHHPDVGLGERLRVVLGAAGAQEEDS